MTDPTYLYALQQLRRLGEILDDMTPNARPLHERYTEFNADARAQVAPRLPLFREPKP